ncbi:MAG: FAD-dependent monooxygenase [Bacteroidetes bacterium]|nr:MAG: FAD-dependent monooxygenase [Bacteroidota bacterium]
MKKVIIVGGGLVGALEAIYMAQRGYDVKVYEKRPDIRKANINAGKSINLVISKRGWASLEKVGLRQEIEPLTVPVYGRMTHDVKGNQNFIPYSSKKEPIYSVSRGGLNAKLLEIAEQYPNVELFFNEKCVNVDLNAPSVTFYNYETQKTQTVQGDLVIGADGAYSEVRNRLMRTDRYNYSQQYIEHGYKELHIPANEDGSPKIDVNALHIWPRKNFMLMALANLDNSFTCTLFFPFEGNPSFESIQTEEDLMKFFQTTFPDAVPLMPTLKEDYFSNPASSLVIIRCYPWHYQNKVVLIGDAAHAIVPFYGEGMNCGFEDCLEFDRILTETNDNLAKALPLYTQTRKPNGDAIADLSLRNFVEMRDLVADEKWLLRKKIEEHMYQKHPDKWIPLYSQVKFTTIPYAQALKEGQKHDAIMEKILALPDIQNKWNSEEIEQQILSML